MVFNAQLRYHLCESDVKPDQQLTPSQPQRSYECKRKRRQMFQWFRQKVKEKEPSRLFDFFSSVASQHGSQSLKKRLKCYYSLVRKLKGSIGDRSRSVLNKQVWKPRKPRPHIDLTFAVVKNQLYIYRHSALRNKCVKESK